MTASPDSIRRLLETHSAFWTGQLKAHPDDLLWLQETFPLEECRSLQGMEAAWRAADWKSLGFADTFRTLCRVKRREMLRITVRELAGVARLAKILSELSALADFCLQRGLAACEAELSKKHGAPQTAFSIFGLGKLGGEELNYSSDIDLILVYSEEGTVERLSHHDYFTRLAERLMEGLRAHNEEGNLFRVDLRLRPDGKSGPIVRSLESYENYYAASGEVWERMALQKARLVAGDPELGYEFNQHLQPFCYPKHLGPSVLDEIFRIKERIENEILKEGGLERHVKLGRGGIREIEFGVQALQLLHGARHPFIQERGTLRSLQALNHLELLQTEEVADLTLAYVFLRRLEHRLQMREDRQTHVVPADAAIQTELAKGLGFQSLEEFTAEWKTHTKKVRAFFKRIVSAREDEEADGKQPSGAARSDGAAVAQLIETLARDDAELPSLDLFQKAGFENPEKAAQTIQTMMRGPEYAHISQRTRDLFKQLCPLVFKIIPSLVRPDYDLRQLERMIGAYGSRGALYEMLLVNPRLLDSLFKLFDHSEFLTNILIYHPYLLDYIAFEGLLIGTHDRVAMEKTFADEGAEKPEDKLRFFRHTELMRIALREIVGLAASPDETHSEMTLLADVCLGYALQLTAVGGKGPPRKSALCIIAMGKYGEGALGYGSDLDVLFVGGTAEEATRIIGMIGGEGQGAGIYKVDARLRPDGMDGPLAPPLEAYASYYQKRAQFWERQALTHARVAAGDARAGAAFMKLVDDTIYRKPISDAEWKELIQMRARIENERGDRDDPLRDFKTGAGGLVDVEFLAQAQQLRHGCEHEQLRRASTVEVIRTMPSIAGWKEEDSRALVEDYNWLRKLENILRRETNSSLSQLPSDRAKWDLPARRLGLKNAAGLEAELTERRKQIRQTTEKMFNLKGAVGG